MSQEYEEVRREVKEVEERSRGMQRAEVPEARHGARWALRRKDRCSTETEEWCWTRVTKTRVSLSQACGLYLALVGPA